MVVPTHPAPILKALARLFLVAVILGTLFLSVALVHEVAFRWLGHEVAASAISIHERPGKAGGPYTHHARYRYGCAGGVERTDDSRISWTAFRRLSTPYITETGRPDDITIPPTAPVTLNVLAYAIGSLAYSRAVEHEWAFAFMLIPAIFAPTGALLSFTLYLAIILRPRQHKRLYTHGAAVAGVVTRKDTRTTKYGTIYWVHYSFTPASGAGTLAAIATVPGQEEYDAAIVGQTVTILHEPENPKRSTIYQYCGFRCV